MTPARSRSARGLAWTSRRLATALLSAFALAAAGCGGAPESAKRAPLLVVGVDGGDPRALRRLFDEGELPHLARLVDRGSFVELASAYGGASPVVWTTMVTGVAPDAHGIVDFMVPTAQGTAPVSSASRRRPALWNLLPRVGRRGALLGLWATWPAETTSGLILSDRFGSKLERDISPPTMRKSLAWTIDSPVYSHRKLVGLRPGLPDAERARVSAELERLIRGCRFRDGGPAFELIPVDAEYAARGAVVEAYIERRAATPTLECDGRKIDKAITYFGGQVTGTHDETDTGILIAAGPGFASGANPTGLSVVDVAPTILYALGMPVAGDFLGQPAVDPCTADFRDDRPLRQIATWGQRDSQVAIDSDADKELIDELVALGYLQLRSRGSASRVPMPTAPSLPHVLVSSPAKSPSLRRSAPASASES